MPTLSKKPPPTMTQYKGVRNPPPIRRNRPNAAKKNPSTCPNAACPEPKIEDLGDKRVCTTCGTVVSDSNIVSEVQFGETSAGAAVVQGTYVGSDQSHARITGTKYKRAGGMESKEVSEANGKRYINQMASALSVPQSTADTAFQIYKVAVIFNFIQGRRTKEVAAVALYMACRRQERNSSMLIDFADVLNVNVFKLGHTFTEFQKKCDIRGFKPVVAENLIYRFATRLEFGRKTEQVAHDAVRLVQRMDKDWMTTGRRPAGICGACLILAARMNNFRRSVREVVYIVKVTDATITQRLEEFKVTPSSALTVDQFRIIDLESTVEPPAFYIQKNGKKGTRRKRGPGDDEGDEDGEDGTPAPDKALPSTENPAPASQPIRHDKDGFAIPALPHVPIDPSLIAASAQALANIEESSSEPSTSNTNEPTATAKDDSFAPPKKRPRGRPRRDGSTAPEPPSLTTPADLAVEEELESEISHFLNDPTTSEHLEAYTVSLNSARALSSIHQPDAGIPTTAEIGPEEFEDDPEVANCVLSPEEVSIKERIWVHENRDYLREQQRKLLKKQLEEKYGTGRVIKRRNRKKRIGEGGEGTSGASTPGEAITRVLERRGFSKKINYGAIARAFEGAGSRLQSREGSVVSTVGPIEGEPASGDQNDDGATGNARVETKKADEEEEEEEEEAGDGEDDVGDEDEGGEAMGEDDYGEPVEEEDELEDIFPEDED
ncbi:MAG: transcription factor TFIIIB subunit brf1 [Caeruleum heppii]|nr:MAG: transcription factor TFIIIB subunit brf1 [Caeruleum heppii]